MFDGERIADDATVRFRNVPSAGRYYSSSLIYYAPRQYIVLLAVLP
jgi:hypothetical protein